MEVSEKEKEGSIEDGEDDREVGETKEERRKETLRTRWR